MTRPQSGIAVIIRDERENQVLLLKRRNEPGAGCWAFPGEEQREYESFEECANRIIKHDTGLAVQLIDSSPHEVVETISRKSGVHYNTGFIRARYTMISGKPQIVHPSEYDGFVWSRWGDLPEPLLSSIKELKERGYNPFG